jgi:hypothetical protein
MREIKKYQEIKNTTDYKIALLYTQLNENDRIVAILEGSKEVYAEGTQHSNPPEGYEFGDEVVHSESEWNECIDYLIEKIKHKPVPIPPTAFVCKRHD